MKTALYRHFNKDNQLLYVGVSASVMRRLSEHNNSSSWAGLITYVSVEYFDSKQEALVAEAAAIKAENPKFNILHKVQVQVRYEQNVVYLDDYRQPVVKVQTGWERATEVAETIINHEENFSHLDLMRIAYRLMRARTGVPI